MLPPAGGQQTFCRFLDSNLLLPLYQTWVSPSLLGDRTQVSVESLFLFQFSAAYFSFILLSWAAGGAYDRIDVFNAITKKWTISSLSAPRIYLAGTSLPEQGLVIFAGGSGAVLCFARPSPCFSYLRFTAGNGNPSYNNVDMYDVASDKWSSTQTLSAARTLLCATSLKQLGIAIFAGGGLTTSGPLDVVDFFYAKDPAARRWTTGQLSIPRWSLSCGSLEMASLAFFAGGEGAASLITRLLRISFACSVPGSISDVIDTWNATGNSWTSAKLTGGRFFLTNAATSLSAGLFFVAGGTGGTPSGLTFVAYSSVLVTSPPSQSHFQQHSMMSLDL